MAFAIGLAMAAFLGALMIMFLWRATRSRGGFDNHPELLVIITVMGMFLALLMPLVYGLWNGNYFWAKWWPW